MARSKDACCSACCVVGGVPCGGWRAVCVLRDSSPWVRLRWLGRMQVMIVPGYGVAVAKAQYAIADIVEMMTGDCLKKEKSLNP